MDSTIGFLFEDSVRKVFNEVEFIYEYPESKKRTGEWIIYDLKDLETWKKEKKKVEDENALLPLHWTQSSVQKNGNSFDDKKLECQSFRINVFKILAKSPLFLVHCLEEPKGYRLYDPKVNFFYFFFYCKAKKDGISSKIFFYFF